MICYRWIVATPENRRAHPDAPVHGIYGGAEILAVPAADPKDCDVVERFSSTLGMAARRG
jgi:hypothetical protein